MSLHALTLVAALAGCAGEEPAKAPVAEVPTQPTAPVAPPAELDLNALKSGATNVALVPSPVEMQKALEKAGIAQQLESLVQQRTLKPDAQDKDVIAVRTGVLLADALLTVKTAPPERLIERLTLVRAGLEKLGAGDDVLRTADDLVAQVKNVGKGSRDKIVEELDAMHGAVLPAIEYKAGAQVVPLIQAGGWLEGSNLLAAAVLASDKVAVGNDLLRQPQIAAHFLEYVKLEGRAQAPDAVVKKLNATLTRLKEIASQPSLAKADVEEIKALTDSVLGML
jgi:hypothetical protein